MKTEIRRQISEQYEQILNAIDDMVLVKGPESRIFWANRAFCTFYGMSNEELRGIVDAPFAKPDYTQQYVRDDAKVFATGKVLEIPREPAVRHDGVVRLFNTVKSPIFDIEARVIMSVGVSRDITDREEQERIIQDQRAKMIASAKMSALGEMAAGIAHEVSNPLTAIVNSAGLLRRMTEIGKLTPEFVIETCSKIEGIAQRVGVIIRALSVFSRRGDQDPFQRVSLGSILQQTISISKERVANSGVKVTLDVKPGINLECRPVEISQVVLNLLNNSLDAIANTPSPWIQVRGFEVGDQVRVSVTDSGSGIPVELRERIIEPFFTTKEAGKGTGLGLSVSRSIVHAHCGNLSIDADSRYTSFVIELPRVQLRSGL